MSSVSSNSSTCSDFTRHSANFHTSIWKDHFLQYALETKEVDEKTKEHITILKENVRKMVVLVHMNEKAGPLAKADITNSIQRLGEVDEKTKEHISILKENVRKMVIHMNENEKAGPMAKAEIIDSIQRLGLCYHFEHEIDEVLQHIHKCYVENGVITLNEDLYSVALVFRLLRQNGYHISPDVFNKFKDEEGNFSKNLVANVEGMLSFYEASHMRTHGEDILDEAFVFTSTHLKLISTQLSPSLCTKVNDSLKRPLLKNLPRIVARNYISTYEENPSHDESLLLFAKLDFNMLQKQHQKEVGNISKWWKDLDFTTKLPFARDRVVEGYFWILGVYFEPQYALARRLLIKVFAIASVIDDIYDAYGTLEELQLFTQAFERWDISNIEYLSEYMKICFKAIFDVYEEIEQEVSKEGRLFCVDYAKNELRRVVQAYLVEAKWFNNNHIPTVEEYMDVAKVSVGYRFITTISFIGMGQIATEKAFQWLTNNPKIVNASIIICRLMDDIVSNEFEQKRGHVVSAVDCYMNEHSATKQDTIDELLRQVRDSWKDINEGFLNPREVAKPLLMRVLNLSRVMDLLYKDEDAYTHSGGSTKNHIEAILLNSLPIQDHELHFFHMDH